MGVINRITGSLLTASAAQSSNAGGSTINGFGVGATFDSGPAAISDSLRSISNAFSNSFLRLNDAVGKVQISKDALENLLVITDDLIEIAERATNLSVNAGERLVLNNKFQTGIREFRDILADAKKEGVDLLDKDDLTDVLENAGIDTGQATNLAQALKRIAGLDDDLGFELIRSKSVTVNVSRKKQFDTRQQQTVTKIVGDGSFNATTSYGNIPGASAVTSGDVDRDGIVDLLVTSDSDGTVSVLIGNGDSTFQAQVSYSVGSSPDALTLKDINNDGINDLLSANSGDDTVSVLLGNPDGSFQAQTTYSVGTGPTTIDTADLDGDGFQDIITSSASGDVSILSGQPGGTFDAASNFSLSAGLQDITIGDFNADGILDLASSDVGGGASIALGTGDGAVASPVGDEVACGTN